MAVNPTMTPPEALEQLAERMDALELRVTQLEQQRQEPAREHVSPALAGAEPVSRVEAVVADAARDAAPLVAAALDSAALDAPSLNAGTFSTTGIALLGIAGAYLLRAVSGTALLPRPLGASLAAVYAAGWAWLAWRNRFRNRTGAMLYALASVLMLGPMLWEMCVRFQAMPAGAGALLLAGYAAAAAVFARGDQQARWLSIAWVGSAGIALALVIGVRQMLPFAAILLAMAAWGEVSRLRGRPLAVTPLVWVAADACVGALLLVYRLPAESRPEYPQIPGAFVLAVPLLLLAMNAVSVATRACGRGERIAIFDMLQVSMALVLCGGGLIWLLPETGRAACAALCVLVAAGCYAAAFARRDVDARNFGVFAVWAPALVICTVFLMLDAPQDSATFAVLAVAAAGAARALRSTALAWHAVLYLGLAEAVSGLFGYTAHEMARSELGLLVPAMGLAAVAALVVYGAARELADEEAPLQALHLVGALLAVWPLDALLTAGLVRGAGLVLMPSAFHVALVRTIALCGLALLLALAGSRLQRVALVRAAYTLTAFAAAKLFFEDLRHGRLDFAAGSIFLVAIALIAIPKVAGKKRVA